MSMEPEFFGVEVTPEMTERLSTVVDEVIELLKKRTMRPEEAFIILDAVTRKLAQEQGMFLLSPVDDTNTGHT